MARQSQSVFYLEWLQPDWLPGRMLQWIVILGPVLLTILVGGLVGGLVEGLLGGRDNGLLFVLLGGLAGGLAAMPENVSDKRIQPAETLTWRWSRFMKHLVIGLGLGLATGNGLLGLTKGLDEGLVPGKITTRNSPNQGIWRSLHNALLSSLVGVMSGVLVGVMFGVLFGRLGGGLLLRLLFGLAFGLPLGLRKGGYACLQHLILRFLLWRKNYAPWHYVRFLDFAVKRTFLLKVGGGYVFIHRMLLEYFATMYPSNSTYKGKASEPVYKSEP